MVQCTQQHPPRTCPACACQLVHLSWLGMSACAPAQTTIEPCAKDLQPQGATAHPHKPGLWVQQHSQGPLLHTHTQSCNTHTHTHTGNRCVNTHPAYTLSAFAMHIVETCARSIHQTWHVFRLDPQHSICCAACRETRSGTHKDLLEDWRLHASSMFNTYTHKPSSAFSQGSQAQLLPHMYIHPVLHIARMPTCHASVAQHYHTHATTRLC